MVKTQWGTHPVPPPTWKEVISHPSILKIRKKSDQTKNPLFLDPSENRR